MENNKDHNLLFSISKTQIDSILDKKTLSASAGSRTRIDCLEGNHANRYTTDAAMCTKQSVHLNHATGCMMRTHECQGC